MFPLYAIPTLIVFACMVALGLFVLFRNPRVLLNRLFAGCAASLALWTFGYSLMYLTRNPVKALFYARLGYLGVVFIPTFFLHFVLEFLGLERKRLVAAAYGVTVLFLVVSRFDLFISGVYVYFWGFYPKAGPLYGIFVLYFYSCCSACVVYLLRVYIPLRKSNASFLKLNQVKYVLLAFFVASLSLSDYLPNYHIEVYPFAYLVAFGWLVLMAYGIFKYRVMDINLIMRKTLVYSVVTGALTIIYLGTITVLTRVFQWLTGSQTVFPSAVAAGLITIFFQPLRKKVQMFIDKKFFRHYVDREEKLYELSREVVTHTTPEAMAEALMRVLGESFHPKSAALYLRSRDGSGFTPVAFLGQSAPESMGEDNPLSKYFADHSQPFVQDLPSEMGAPHSTRQEPQNARGTREAA